MRKRRKGTNLVSLVSINAEVKKKTLIINFKLLERGEKFRKGKEK
jgi:hypothetical protein